LWRDFFPLSQFASKGRSHQTLFAKQKLSGAQRSDKNLTFNFINSTSLTGHAGHALIMAQNSELLAKCHMPFVDEFVHRSPN